MCIRSDRPVNSYTTRATRRRVTVQVEANDKSEGTA